MNWISVKDQLPKSKKEILVFDAKDGIEFANYKLGRFLYPGCSCCAPLLDNVTHWMELPEKPNVKKD